MAGVGVLIFYCAVHLKLITVKVVIVIGIEGRSKV